MSRFQFEIPDEDAAREFAPWRREAGMHQAELYHDAVSCERRVLAVTTPLERAAAREYAVITKTLSHPCAGCGRFAFATADVRCFWCKRGGE